MARLADAGLFRDFRFVTPAAENALANVALEGASTRSSFSTASTDDGPAGIPWHSSQARTFKAWAITSGSVWRGLRFGRREPGSVARIGPCA